MGAFTLSRAAIRAATGWRYHRVRTLIEYPYRLPSRFDRPAPQGGGRTERFRLSDILTRARSKRNYHEETMTPRLIAAHRKEKTA